MRTCDLATPFVCNPSSRRTDPPGSRPRQLQLLFQDMSHRLDRVQCPLLAMHSRVDHTVHPSNSRRIYAAVASQRKRLYELQQGWHVASLDAGRQQMLDETLAFLKP